MCVCVCSRQVSRCPCVCWVNTKPSIKQKFKDRTMFGHIRFSVNFFFFARIKAKGQCIWEKKKVKQTSADLMELCSRMDDFWHRFVLYKLPLRFDRMRNHQVEDVFKREWMFGNRGRGGRGEGGGEIKGKVEGKIVRRTTKNANKIWNYRCALFGHTFTFYWTETEVSLFGKKTKMKRT